jgi:hypothetical protein
MNLKHRRGRVVHRLLDEENTVTPGQAGQQLLRPLVNKTPAQVRKYDNRYHAVLLIIQIASFIAQLAGEQALGMAQLTGRIR